jgi:hypothetical protein
MYLREFAFGKSFAEVGWIEDGLGEELYFFDFG